MLMLDRAIIAHRDDKRLEVQNQWSSVMLRAIDLSLHITSDCRSAISVKSSGTMHVSVVPHAQYQGVLSEMIGHFTKILI